MQYTLCYHAAWMQPWRVTCQCCIYASYRPYVIETVPKGQHDAFVNAALAMVRYSPGCIHASCRPRTQHIIALCMFIRVWRSPKWTFLISNNNNNNNSLFLGACLPQRYHSAYIGACALANLQEFEQACISADEWSETGPPCLRKWHMY